MVAVVGDVQQEKGLREAAQKIESDKLPGAGLERVEGDPAAEEDGEADGDLDPHGAVGFGGDVAARRRTVRGGGAGPWGKKLRWRARCGLLQAASEGTRSSMGSGALKINHRFGHDVTGSSAIVSGRSGQLADAAGSSGECRRRLHRGCQRSLDGSAKYDGNQGNSDRMQPRGRTVWARHDGFRAMACFALLP